MRLQWPHFFTGALALAVALAPAAVRAEEVTITGCAQAGVEAGCVVLNSGGKLYNITAAKPAPKLGVPGTVTGTVLADSASFCQQGIILSAATWAPVGGATCPDAAPRWTEIPLTGFPCASQIEFLGSARSDLTAKPLKRLVGAPGLEPGAR
jgi:hypothetical protein